ncbi:MAG TPA: efflux RND transporter periplasmic adaptor subunit [Candidatus Baltobacteraceae bacterium]|nr:efflux RND transporter periplasmic adaptor subunit [Candidatus Baltobacteraceae bacterium]
MKRIVTLAAIAAGIVVILVIAKFANHSAQDAITVSTATVRLGTFQTKLPENGVVQHPRAATIPTLVAGNISEIDAKPGDYVHAGQLLATIENASLESAAAGSRADYTSAAANVRTARINEQNARVTYEGQVQTAKANLDEAKRVYDADVALYKQQAIPRNLLDTDRATLDKMQVAYDQAVRQLNLGAVTGYGENSVQYAQAAAQKAAITNAADQQQLSFTRIVAPFSGTIQTVATQSGDPLTPLRQGDAVAQGQMLFTIAEGGSYIVKAQVDEQDVMSVHAGQRAIVSGQDFPGKHIAGHVASIAPVATKSTDASSTAKQVLTTIRLDDSPPYLKDGMTVDVDLLTADVSHATLVPSSAIVNDKGKSYVYVVRKDVAHKVQVKTGASNDSDTIVLAGVAPGAVVVSKTLPSLREGVRVTVAPSPSPHPAS